MEKDPIDCYTDALDSLREGDREKAAEDLSQALGSDRVTQPIKNDVEQFLEKGTCAHGIALRILEARIRRRADGR